MSHNGDLSKFLVLSCVLAFPALAEVMVSVSETGRWPSEWPSELEPLRKQSRTLNVATGIQQQIHEIHFSSKSQFAEAWPTLLKIKTPVSPVRLMWTNDPPPRVWGNLLTNGGAVVRIYTPAYNGSAAPNTEADLAPLRSTNGSLPEYVALSTGLGRNRWVPAPGSEQAKGFHYRARVDLEIVLDGQTIGPADVRLPAGTPVESEGLRVPALTQAERSQLCREAQEAFSKHVRGDPATRTNEIPAGHWGPLLKKLKPLRVVDENVNIKVVLGERNGIEAGFYVNLMISSFLPRPERFLEWLPLNHYSTPSESLMLGSLYRYKLVKQEKVDP